MARITRLQHLVLNCRNVEESVEFYTNVLGMEVVSNNTERKMAFLSFGKEHHDIALFEYADVDNALEPNHLGMNHIAMEIDGGEEELKDMYDKLKAHNVKIDRLMDHVISKSVYFFDPDGNRLEIFCDTMGEKAKDWLRDNGGVAKPYSLEEVAVS